MTEIINMMNDADIVIFVTPVNCDNMSSTLKAFIDRAMIIATPYWGQDNYGKCQHLQKKSPPKLIMMANCGYPKRTQFQVISNWIKRYARNLNKELLCEIYTPQCSLLNFKNGELGKVVSNYIKNLEQAGEEIVSDVKLNDATKCALEQNFILNEIYIKEVRKYINQLLSNK